MSDPEDYAIPCKVVLVGESGCDRTGIIIKFVCDTFMSTIGPSIVKNLFIEELNQVIQFEIWDTASHERYRSINRIF